MQLIKAKSKEPVPFQEQKLAIDTVADEEQVIKIKEVMGTSQYLNDDEEDIVKKARNPKSSLNQSKN